MNQTTRSLGKRFRVVPVGTKIALTWIIFLTIAAVSQAQVKTAKIIEIDSVSGMFSESLPFDQPFTLKKYYNEPIKPISVEIYEINKRGKIKSTPIPKLAKMILEKEGYASPYFYRISKVITYKSHKRRQKKLLASKRADYEYDLHYPVNYTTKDRVVINKKDNAKTELYIIVPPLKPRKQYKFIIHREGNSNVQAFYKIGKEVANTPLFSPVAGAQSFRTNKDTIVAQAPGLANVFYTNGIERTAVDYQNDLSKAHIKLPNHTESLYLVRKENTSGLTARGISNGNTLQGYSIDAGINYTYILNVNYLEDITGSLLVDGAAYCFVVKEYNHKHHRQELKISKAYFKRGNYFEMDASDNDPTHSFPVTITHPPLVNYRNIENLLREVTTQINRRHPGSISFDASVQDLIQKAYVHPCSTNINVQELICKSPATFNASAHKFTHPNTAEWRSLLMGHSAVSSTYIDAGKEEENLEKRLQNLKALQKFVDDLIFFTNYLRVNGIVSSRGNYNDLYIELQNLQQLITDAIKPRIEKAQAAKSQIIQDISRFEYVKETTHHIGSTDDFNFKTRSKLNIVPDFGFVIVPRSIRGFSAKLNQLAYSPYLGFNINFRSINKDIPFGLIKYKTVWHRLSFMSGILLTKLKIEGEREDLFANNSLMAGLGLRINNVVKFSSGVVLYKSLDPNPTIDNPRLGISPYAGLSLDLEVQELFGGISSLFK
jgi:hypothetical protein